MIHGRHGLKNSLGSAMWQITPMSQTFVLGGTDGLIKDLQWNDMLGNVVVVVVVVVVVIG
jgi:hypothetical protein